MNTFTDTWSHRYSILFDKKKPSLQPSTQSEIIKRIFPKVVHTGVIGLETIMSATSLISCLGSEDNGLLIVNWSSSGGIGITEFASCRQRGHQYSPLLTAKFPVISCVCSNKHKLSSISCPNVQRKLSM